MKPPTHVSTADGGEEQVACLYLTEDALRVSFDKMKYRDNILRALKLVDKHGVKASFFCYMLFNFYDRPEDFWNRIVLTQQMVDDVGRTVFLFPQRFEPYNALQRNTFIGKHWNEDLVRGITRMYTWLHGFLPCTTTKNIFRWIGFSFEEMMDNAYKFVKEKDYGKRFTETKNSREGVKVPNLRLV